MSDEIKDVPVGFLDAQYVDQIRNHMGVDFVLDQAQLKANLFQYLNQVMAKRNANGSLENIISKQLYKKSTQSTGQQVTTVLVNLSTLIGDPATLLFYGAWIAAAFTGSYDASVTLAVLNLGDEPLELMEVPHCPHGDPTAQPAVMSGSNKLNPPDLPSGGSGQLTAWICSPVQEQMSGYASVGIWRFDHPTSSLFAGVSGTLRLSYKKYGVDILLGGQWPKVGAYKNSFSAALNNTGNVSAESFFDDHVDEKDSSKLVKQTLTTDKGTFSITAGDENSFSAAGNAPDRRSNYFIVAIVDGKGNA